MVMPVTAGHFDAAARFTDRSPASVPPPPPGCVPNAAQLANMGVAVAGRPPGAADPRSIPQKKGGFLNGSGNGGYTFW